MASLAAVNLYLCANVLLVLAAASLWAIRAVSARLQYPIAYRDQLWSGYSLAIATVLLPLTASLIGHESLLPKTAQVWSASTMRDGVHALGEHRISMAIAPASTLVPLDIVSRSVAATFLVGLLLLLVRLAIDVSATVRIIDSAHLIRRHGRLRILASDRIPTPFSFWLPRFHFVIVPSALVLNPDDLRMAIRHEVQHHRQMDTKLLYYLQLLRALFFWNPAVHILEKHVAQLREFACDEAVTRHRTISAQEYCRCLLRVAEAAMQRRVVVRAGMAGSSAGVILIRRIEAMLNRPTHHLRKPAVVAGVGAAGALMAVTAMAFATTIGDRRVSAESALRMAAIAQEGSRFPIVVNDRVVEQLGLLLGTPDGRAFLRASLDRMQNHSALISEHIARYAVPAELLAVPLVESGYRNLPRGDDPRQGAGLWMFIEPTARSLGLHVTENVDERLNVAAETDAAMRLFTNLQRQFDDWSLALLAYNIGSSQVEKGIRVTGTRDVWEITRRGYENDRDYLPRVMAAILIIKNPAVLE